jgi:hypothetical protein
MQVAKSVGPIYLKFLPVTISILAEIAWAVLEFEPKMI